MDVWIVLIEDIHNDVNALPFSSEILATEVACKKVTQLAWHQDDIEWDAHISPRAEEEGIMFLAVYGTEGNMVSVMKRTIDSPE